MNRSSGFSLLELLVVVGILGILLAIGVVNLHPERFAVRQAAVGLAAQVSRARLEAIKNNRSAGLRVLTSGAGGYQVCVDLDNSGGCADSEAVQTVTFGQGDFGRVKLASSSVTLMLFDTRGIPLNALSGNIVLSDRGGSFTKTVAVNAAGRAVVQ